MASQKKIFSRNMLCNWKRLFLPPNKKDTYYYLQGDQNQNLLIEMAITLILSLFDSILVKPKMPKFTLKLQTNLGLPNTLWLFKDRVRNAYFQGCANLNLRILIWVTLNLNLVGKFKNNFQVDLNSLKTLSLPLPISESFPTLKMNLLRWAKSTYIEKVTLDWFEISIKKWAILHLIINSFAKLVHFYGNTGCFKTNLTSSKT